MSHPCTEDEENSSLRHLEIEELTAYHEGRLGEEAYRHVEEHLNSCPDCAEFLAEFAAFEPTTVAGEQATGRIAAEEVFARLRRERWRRISAVAATFAIMTFGALFWAQRKSTNRSEKPQFDIALGIRDSAPEIEFPAKTQRFALRFAGDAIIAGERYGVRATNRNGQTIATMVGLVADVRGVVRMELDASLFPTGSYDFSVKPERSHPGQPPTLVVTLRIRNTT